MRRSSGKSLAPILLILLAGLFMRFMTADNDVKDIQKIGSKLKSINDQTAAMTAAVGGASPAAPAGEISNIGDKNIDRSYVTIRRLLTEQKDVKLTRRQSDVLIAGAHYLIFENAMTKAKQQYCMQYGVDISDYFSLYYKENKDVRTALRNFLNAYGFVELMKQTVTSALNDDGVKAGIRAFVAGDFAETENRTGKSVEEICKTLPMGDLVYGDRFGDAVRYKTKFAYNYKQIGGE